ncbi:MAG: hypothetical protein US68_C0008G0095 [Candidatus Shapirobacteria bacterium GW2011_GWE1_38_10]|uniref:Uncharacterized protein n=1 Tax=Candidatus Shapirobacteria bacterium GW2011_GWE1_38_10 TaxID=1618488 RepID=A0A0G0IGU5_9BACT|nr:MAG: hypothetical protein US46_C0006G0049 [Candidatus Shapirobacteria bacterium GW2011_GWF2_37_20]KKQ50210.1 MAG: hypothetical protein US68_C0008G0095 [Candidatus Shapirobacteria bacterium GW2011_GWE1_38_10]KKQ63771.1 MAG: hypothetical protein US85_C0014G0003 [Candidatus Shapirobacteria bacterium GW2011_GWF1_38_23]HBP50739.1 hypothetical protein [Candidatus Shapirobacteria bacterium]
MTKIENQTKVKNFEIGPNGEIIKNGEQLKPRLGIKAVPKNDIEEKVSTPPVEIPKKRTRWLKGSFVNKEQELTEIHETENHIA